MLNFRLAIRFIINPQKGSFSSYASWLTIIGLAIGVTALMLTTSIIDGFEEVVSNKLSNIEGQGRIRHILDKQFRLDNEQIKALLNNPNITVHPFMRGACLIRKGVNLDGVFIEGVNKYPTLLSGVDSNDIKNNEIILGEVLASSLNAKIGDKIFLQNFYSSEVSFSSPNILPFKVTNIFNSGLQEYDKNMAYISLEKAQILFGNGANDITGLIVQENNNSNINVHYPFYFETWKERHALLFEWMTVQQWPAYIMFGLIIFVGLVNLFAAIAMIIIEKNGSIALLLTQGIPDLSLKNVFVLQGAIIGILGSLIGGVFSVGLIKIQMKYSILKIPSDIYFMDQIPFSFQMNKYFIILFLVCLCSMIASWWSTFSFKNINTSKVLRYE